MKIILILLFIICTTFQINAGLFDDRYPSAKATAMGGAGTAVGNDVWASYYNPAYLGAIDKMKG